MSISLISDKTLFITVWSVYPFSQSVYSLFKTGGQDQNLQNRPKILSNSSTYITGKCIFNFCRLRGFFSFKTVIFEQKKYKTKNRTGTLSYRKIQAFMAYILYFEETVCKTIFPAFLHLAAWRVFSFKFCTLKRICCHTRFM